MRLDHGTRQAARAQIRFETATQCGLITAETVAGAVQRLDRGRRLATDAAVLRRGMRGNASIERNGHRDIRGSGFWDNRGGDLTL